MPTTQPKILVGQLPSYLEYRRRIAHLLDRRVWGSSRMHHLLEYFLLGTGFGSTGTSAFGGTATNTTGSIFGGGTATGFGGGTSTVFTPTWIILLDSIRMGYT